MQEQNRPMSLESRVRRLERANRALLAGFGAAGLLLLLGAAGSDTAPEVVRTRSLEVVNEAGAVQARVTSSPAGAALEFLDEAGATRISLGHGPEDTALFKDGQGTTRIGVARFAHGGGGFALHGEDAKGGGPRPEGGEGFPQLLRSRRERYPPAA